MRCHFAILPKMSFIPRNYKFFQRASFTLRTMATASHFAWAHTSGGGGGWSSVIFDFPN